jgi:hypothetical protein
MDLQRATIGESEKEYKTAPETKTQSVLAIFLLDYCQSISPVVLFIGSRTGKNFQERVQLWFGKSASAPSRIPKFLGKEAYIFFKSIMDEGTFKTPIP